MICLLSTECRKLLKTLLATSLHHQQSGSPPFFFFLSLILQQKWEINSFSAWIVHLEFKSPDTCVNSILKLDVKKEGKEDERRLQIAGSFLRKGHCPGGLKTFGLGRGVIPGIWGPAFCLHPPSPSIPSLDCTCKGFSSAFAQTSFKWKCSGWERVLAQEALGHILCSGEKQTDWLARSRPFSTHQFRAVVTK